MAENPYSYGCKNAHYALETASGFGAWKPMPGIVNITLAPQESQNDFYADDSLYATIQGAASDEVTIEIADFTDEMKKDLLGYEEVNDGLALPVNYKPATFVLGFEVNGSVEKARINVYGGKLTRSQEAHATQQENPEVQTLSYTGKFKGRTFTVDGEDVAYLYFGTKSSKNNFASWWDAVATPGTVVAATTTNP